MGLWKQLILSVATIAMAAALSGGAEARGTFGWAGFGGGALPPYYVGRPYYGALVRLPVLWLLRRWLRRLLHANSACGLFTAWNCDYKTRARLLLASKHRKSIAKEIACGRAVSLIQFSAGQLPLCDCTCHSGSTLGRHHGISLRCRNHVSRMGARQSNSSGRQV